MSEQLTPDEVKNIAQLAQIHLIDEEVERYRQQLVAILAYVGMLNEVTTLGVEPTAQVTGMVNRMRPDEVWPSLSQSEALMNAPAQLRGYFKIKAVL